MTKTPEQKQDCVASQMAEEYADDRCGNWEECEHDNEWEEAKRGFLAGYQAAKLQWISVKDRLPEEGALVLTYGADGIIDVLARYRASKNSWKWGRDGEFITLVFNLTHWMPLPEAPKE